MIQGTGFTDALSSSIGELAVKSATEAILKISDPEVAVVVTFDQSRHGSTSEDYCVAHNRTQITVTRPLC